MLLSDQVIPHLTAHPFSNKTSSNVWPKIVLSPISIDFLTFELLRYVQDILIISVQITSDILLSKMSSRYYVHLPSLDHFAPIYTSKVMSLRCSLTYLAYNTRHQFPPNWNSGLGEITCLFIKWPFRLSRGQFSLIWDSFSSSFAKTAIERKQNIITKVKRWQISCNAYRV